MDRVEFHSETGDPTVQTVGQWVRQMRLQQNLTQLELAELGGLSASAVSMIEREKRMPSIRTLRKLATALGCNLLELLGLQRIP